MSEIYDLGYSAGSYVATTCPKIIREAVQNETLGILAGKKLDHILKGAPRPDDGYTRAANWKAGFFDGFLSKAEELLHETEKIRSPKV